MHSGEDGGMGTTTGRWNRQSGNKRKSGVEKRGSEWATESTVVIRNPTSTALAAPPPRDQGAHRKDLQSQLSSHRPPNFPTLYPESSAAGQSLSYHPSAWVLGLALCNSLGKGMMGAEPWPSSWLDSIHDSADREGEELGRLGKGSLKK